MGEHKETRGGLNLPGAVPREAPEEPSRRQQRPPTERPAEHLGEYHRAGRHQCPAPAIMLPGRLLVHGGARHDPHTPWSRRGRSCREVTAIAVEREELFGEQRGEVVGADRDVEARLGAGDHDPDREILQKP